MMENKKCLKPPTSNSWLALPHESDVSQRIAPPQLHFLALQAAQEARQAVGILTVVLCFHQQHSAALPGN